MTGPKKPPLAKAIREFVQGLQLPPAPEHGPNPNPDHAALVLAMLQHCNGLTSGAPTAICSPSLIQVARLRHCSKRTIQRQMAELREIGIVTDQRRGTASNLYAIHKIPAAQKTGQQLSSRATRQQLSHRGASSGDNPVLTTGQLDPVVATTVVHLRGSLSGVNPQEKTNTKAPVFDVPGWVPVEPWTGFCEMRRSTRRKLTPYGAKLIVRELDRLRGEGQDVTEVLNRSTMYSWAGVFPVTQPAAAKPSRPSLAGTDYSKGLEGFVVGGGAQ
jgi:hypothetical protein